MTSLPKALFDRTLAKLEGLEELELVRGEDLFSVMGPDPVGRLEVRTGTKVAKVVTISLVVPQIGMDSHMVFAFSPDDSALPHFTLDSVEAGGNLAFHLDLVPRAELASHLAYVNTVFEPLSPVFERSKEVFGSLRAAIGPRQYAMMSPWMLVNRASEEQFKAFDAFVDDYFAHWSALVESGLPPEVLATLADTDLAARDRANRENLFSPEVDPVWERVTRLVGQETSDRLRAELISNEVAA
ncbi:hypothetical protein [Actinocorallia libanotica]|uniref:Uncharacterized protein n=1 Tax=Actinocorallia libanotica TaxID=46162 RepID=A0ABP4CFP6_9ACTN